MDTRLQNFIKEASKRFNDKFDYSISKYEKRDDLIQFICPNHGIIDQRVDVHLNSKHGCPQCAVDYTLKRYRENFIKRSKELHGNNIDYSRVEYKDAFTKVELRCIEHGLTFYQIPNAHIRKSGCMKCKVEKCRKSQEQFLEDCRKTHGDRYNYSKAEYRGAKEKVIVACSIHGEWEVEASSHALGTGCPQCMNIQSGEKQKYSEFDFINKAVEIHGNKYDYSQLGYTEFSNKVNIICPKHGSWEQLPGNHLSGKGCTPCSYQRAMFGYSKTDFLNASKDGLARLYFIECWNKEERFTKIGITTKPSIRKRFPAKNTMPYNFCVLKEIIGEVDKIWDLEHEIQRSLKEYKYRPLIEFGGFTECFTTDIKNIEINFKI